MKKTWLLTAAALIGLLASCRHPASPSTQPGISQNTAVVFDNTQGICAVVVYDHYQRREEDKIAEVPAGGSSAEIEWTPGDSVPFYFSYRINLKGINGFTLNYVPEIGKDQKAVRIDPNVKTPITIPRLEETLSSPDTLLSNYSYLLIQNNSSYSFQLHRGSGILSPDNIPTPLVNSGERAQYTTNPGAASNYRLLVGADYKALPASLASFEAGRVYSFIFDGSISLITEVEIKLENVAGVPQNTSGPDAPGAPVVMAEDGLLTLRWIAVEGAENYELYVSTAKEPPASPAKTVAGTTTVLIGLTNKTAYYVWIKALNSSGSSDFSPRSRGIPWPYNERPATPERLEIIPGINQLTVNWDECGGAVSYEVYFNTSTTRPPAPEITTEKTSAVIKNLENDIIYYVWVRAVNSAGESGYSPLEAGTPKIPTTAPAAPGKPVLTAGSRKLTASWQAVELAAAYEIWAGTSDNPAQAEKHGDDLDGDITEAVITGLENETVYYVWIRAKNIVGLSGFSPAATVKPSAFASLPVVPDAPAVSPGSRALTVSWLPAEGALSYEAWISVTNNPDDGEKHGADASGTSVTLTNLVNGTTYYIWVKAKNNIGTSEFSPVASGTPLGTPGAPTLNPGFGQLVATWTAVAGADEYEVYYGTTNAPTTLAATITGTTATITGLTNGTTYYVRLRAKNASGISDYGPTASGKPTAQRTPGLYRGDFKIGNQNLADSLTYISTNAVSGDDYYIVLGANESISPARLDYSGKTVEINLLGYVGYGSEKIISPNENVSGHMFMVLSGVTLILDENITLVGRSTNNYNFVYISGGNLIVNDGANIRSTIFSGASPAAGVYVVGGGTFTMNGGEISGNTSTSSPSTSYTGVCVVGHNGTFTMNGGKISGNTTSSFGGSVYIMANGTFTMNGGEISGNSSRGVESRGTFTLNGGKISGNSSSGVIVGNNGNSITSTFTMNGGIISGNTSSQGGGVYVNGGGSFIMNGGVISGNTATGTGGGGVRVFGTFTMNGGIISGNTTSGSGGGVYLSNSGIFKKLPSSGSDQNSGIIYGLDAVGVDENGVPLKNTTGSDNNGHAVDYSPSGGAASWRYRATTAGQTDHIDTTTGKGLSKSGNPPFGQ